MTTATKMMMMMMIINGGAPWVRKCGKLPFRENLLIGSLSNHDDDGNKNPTNLHI